MSTSTIRYGDTPDKPVTEPREGRPSGMSKLLILVVVVLSVDLALRIEERQYRVKAEERRSHDEGTRRAVIDAVVKASAEIDQKRGDVFSEYVKDLASYETKSVYHQIYHASNAQLKIQNLAVQEHQLLIQILAGKR